MDYKKVTDQFAVAPQIHLEDVATIKELGYVAIINNRPDGEVPGQPLIEDIKNQALAQGMQFIDLPIVSGTLPMEAIEQTKVSLAQIDGPVFAYCRTGTRSITLWALSQIGTLDGQEISSCVKNAGYDLPFLDHYL